MGRSSNDLNLHSSPSLAHLSEYEYQKAMCLRERSKYTKAIATTTAVLRKYEQPHEDALKTIKELRTQIRENTKGMPTDPFEDTLYMGMAASQRETDAAKAICKGLYKVLAQKLHPDKGGDPELFAEIHQAYKQYDIDFLRIQYTLLESESSLNWKISEGVAFWHAQWERAAQDFKILQESKWFTVVRFHMTGQQALAEKAMAETLKHRIFELRSEFNHLVTKK
ncbi:DnaJ-like chaperone protein [Achromobacter phage Motura]|uniref:DnaJ-like chaperone protein n=1 Tax=Achromobacter phage Motura TaxID=2591403 RepID=A0A514CSK2_9CAUD|nr:DnaJ-like chaperone protein [Achromobacter phage Motura]QDH83459.1 DnaJ-like chaperone protein [Achromobacter phage Motura]